ncbi:BT4734/BF3469 family protein [Larkinella insperata]|uniref:BT4734/BF3469 family protein n=1 Tax=Larkinella insperata TaxID=332158 RepID=A0ABW3Q323_9BACT|nr:BT4734/BF3469 family protein [Larkinella insperata]
MTSILDVQVSCFKCCKAPSEPRPVNMLTWLRSPKYYDEQLRLRELAASDPEQYRQEKIVKLPAVTPFAEFTYRKNDAFKGDDAETSYSGLYCLDIDQKDNPHIENFHQLKQEFCKIKNVAYCGLSLSGNGYFLLIPVAEPRRHLEYFEAFKKLFAAWDITIDRACKDNSRLRIYSHDPAAYYNHRAEKVVLPPPKPKPVYRPPVSRQQRATDPASTQHKIEQLIQKIAAHRIDITDGYQNWRTLGFALVDEFGEGGRDYFHQISYHNAKYDHAYTDKQYTDFLKHHQGHGGKRITIGSFFAICQDYGIAYERPDKSTAERRPRTEKPRSKWDNPPIEVIPIVQAEEDYPKSWDGSPGQPPTARLVVSPRRAEFATALNLSEEALQLYTLEPITP